MEGPTADPAGVGEGPLQRGVGATAAATAEGELAGALEGGARAGGRSQGGREGGPRRDKRGGATQALEEEDGGDAAPEMNVLCGVDSDKEEGIFGLREVGDISQEEAAAAFSSDEEEED